MSYLKRTTAADVPQSEALPGQVPNSAGGFAWEVGPFERMRRFLILGTEGGTYYINEYKLTMQNIESVAECLNADPARAIEMIVDVSKNGRAPKNDPAVYALAMAASHPSIETRTLALRHLRDVCRIGTHLFMFCDFIDTMRGWGPALRKAVADWYTERDRDDLANQVVKYRQRGGWTHKDVMRLAHPEAKEHADTFGFISGLVDHEQTTGQHKDRNVVVRQGRPWEPSEATPRMIQGYLEAQRADTPKDSARLIREYGLPRECIITAHLNDLGVWDALLESMPMTATIRNLGKMSSIGLVTDNSEAARTVIERITNAESLRRARVHPINVLAAMTTYGGGSGIRGSLTWRPVQTVVDALDEAFYMTFDNVVPTEKRWLLGIDVSSSMMSCLNAIPNLSNAMGAGAMAMLAARTEKQYVVRGFAGDFVDLNITPRDRLDTTVRKVQDRNFGTTDCALPMIWADKNKIDVDVFAVYTDNETWAGSVHPSVALQKYRERTGIDAKLVVVGMASNGFSIADPNDSGMLDVVGFDTSAPPVMADFARGAV